jgi:hypothetical protein
MKCAKCKNPRAQLWFIDNMTKSVWRTRYCDEHVGNSLDYYSSEEAAKRALIEALL